jgi:[acyl-carrier-protein] S-malonyltransferase
VSANGACAGLFPGQGSQEAAMRERVAAVTPRMLALCIELVGEDPFPRVAESTAFAQPAIFCASFASWTLYRDALQADMFAGHSLGEICALVAAEALSPEAGLKLAVVRGQLMAGARDGGMLALLGISAEDAERFAADSSLVVANYNAADQFVLSGSIDAIDAARDRARTYGVTAMKLGVSGAFHSPLMADAAQRFREILRSVSFAEPRRTVVSGGSGKPFVDLPRELADAVEQPVRWLDTLTSMRSAGIRTFVDLGPGTTLAGLARRTVTDASVLDAKALAARFGSD